MPSKALVVDANILIRAVLGKRVRAVIETYAERVSFFVPEVAYAEAEDHLPALVIRHGFGALQNWVLPQFPCRSRGALW